MLVPFKLLGSLQATFSNALSSNEYIGILMKVSLEFVECLP